MAAEDPTLALVFAIVALVFSALSAAAAIAAVWQAFHLHPKPFIVPRVYRDEQTQEENPTFIFSLVNFGPASAHDVRLVLRNFSTGNFYKVLTLNELSVSVPTNEYISMVDGRPRSRWEFVDGIVRPQVGASEHLLMEFEVTWRQGPKMTVIHRDQWEVTVSPDSNVILRPVRRGEIKKRATKAERLRLKEVEED